MERLLRGTSLVLLVFALLSCSTEQGNPTGEEARPAPEEITKEVTKVVTVAEAPKQDKPTAPNPERQPERRPAAAPTPELQPEPQSEPQPEPVDDAPSDEQYEPGSPSEPATDPSAPEAQGGTDATLVVGETATTDEGNGITVHSYEYVPPTDVWEPEPGFEFNAADVEACANPSLEGSTDFNPSYFGLQMPDNTRLQTDVGVKEPALNLTTLVPGDCVRGYVTFQVPEGETPSYLVYEVYGSSIVKWAVQEVVRAEGAQYEPESTSEAEATFPEAPSDESTSLAPSEDEPTTDPQYETTPPTTTPSDAPQQYETAPSDEPGGGETSEETTAPEESEQY